MLNYIGKYPVAAPERVQELAHDSVLGERLTYHGDISRPKDNGRVSQLSGNMYVFAGSSRDPGEVGLINPSRTRMSTTNGRSASSLS